MKQIMIINKKSLISKAAIIFLSLTIISCADSKKSYDHEKAVSIFIDSQLAVDSSLLKTEITIPAQKNNQYWYGFRSEKNQEIDNFLLEVKDLKKPNKLYSSYNGSLDYRMVFSPVIIDDTSYFLNSQGSLSAFDLKTQKIIWQKRIFPIKIFKNYQSPKISYNDGKIFAIAGSNKVVAINPENGEIIWSKDISSIPISTPISDTKSLFFITNDNKLYCLDANNGDIKWVHFGISKNTAILGSANPVLYKNAIIASYSSGEIYAINKENGQTLWSQDLNINKLTNSDFYLNDIDATPIIKNNIIYTVGNGGLMMAINLDHGNIVWKKELATIYDFWIAGDFIYLINSENKLIAIQAKTGGIKWISNLPDLANKDKPESKIIYSGIIMAGDKLIVTDTSGKLLIISPKDGKLENEIKLDQKIYQNAIIVNSRIYLNTVGGYNITLIEISASKTKKFELNIFN
jgi:outer membrane protein assembly factor BamB